jgi:subtilisin
MTSLLILLVVLVSFTTVSAQPLPDEPSGSGESTGRSDSSRLLQKAQQEGSVRAIVGLRTDFKPEGQLNRAQVDDQRAAIESAGAGLQADLAGTEYRTLREYETVPYIALSLTPEAFRAVQNSARTTTIHEDVAVPPDLTESAPIVQAPIMWENNLTGSGKTIAVLDTGVDRLHPFLGGRVVEEACFSSGSDCPNGRTTQTGTDSGAPCTYAGNCVHGTHVAGIAAGQGINDTGMAPNANIMSVQVFHRATGTACVEEDPCTKSSPSDLIAGLERVYQLRDTRSFASVNMSLGGGRFTRNCDTTQAPLKAVIDNLKAAGIATVIASGNDGFTDAVASPACISSAITVGSTTNQDTIAPDSNFSSMVDLLAPGVGIRSSVPGGNFATKSGTSMAAPHVAGAWALLEERDPFKTVNDISYALRDTGKLVKDTRAGGYLYSGHRINIAEAANVRPLADDFGSPKSLSGASFSVPGINEAATRENGEPDHLPADGASLGENSVWYSWTAPFSGPVTMDTCQSNFDTALAVYTGSGAIDSLSQVASDNDSCSNFNDAGSQLSFDAVAGRNYRIAVAGFSRSASEGMFTLTTFHDPPSNDYFFGAQVISGNSATVEGTTLLATREPDEPDHYPDNFFLQGEHSVWYSWTAPSSGPVEMNTCQANISSTIAVYTGSGLSTLSRVADNRYACPSALGSKVTFDATAGTTYRIAVAEPGGDHTQNTFTLEVGDRKPPTVTRTSPADNATGIARGADLKATFSEPMRASTITASTFKLTKQGATSNVSATVTYDPATNTATLNPNTNLTAGATYTVTVTTQARDLAGNGLDQNPNLANNQPKSWKFTVQ